MSSKYEYNLSVSIVVEAVDLEEAEEHADDIMTDLLESYKYPVINADWYKISPIRKCRPKKTPAKARRKKATRQAAANRRKHE